MKKGKNIKACYLEGLNFSEYQNFVESHIFETQLALEKHNQLIFSHKRNIFFGYFLFFMGIISLVILPILSIALDFFNGNHDLYNLLSSGISVIFSVAFLSFIKLKFLKKLRARKRKQRERDLNLALLAIFHYGNSTLETFFNGKEEIRVEFFKQKTSEELKSIENGLFELDFNLSVFEDFLKRSYRCNIDQVVLDDGKYLYKRDESEVFLRNYYNHLLNKSS